MYECISRLKDRGRKEIMSQLRARTTTLQGDPGSGKSMMGALTAVRKPVHVIDIDRKLASAGWAEKALQSKELTYWELAEAFDDTNFKNRLDGLGRDLRKATPLQPQGIIKFAEYVYSMPKNQDAMAAGTWMFDSLTMLNEHAKTLIMHLAGRSKFTFDQWTALKVWWMETMSCIRDIARENNKDLIFTVHERFKEEPGDRTTGVRMEAVKSGDDISLQKTYVGTQDVKVWASIDGAFGDLIGAQCDEYYYIYVKINEGKPQWRCRVQPDGRRSLRTSFPNRDVEYECDFRKIWK